MMLLILALDANRLDVFKSLRLLAFKPRKPFQESLIEFLLYHYAYKNR